MKSKNIPVNKEVFNKAKKTVEFRSWLRREHAGYLSTVPAARS